MSGETDPHTQRAQAGWNSFSWVLGLSGGAIVVALGLMAIFLL